MHKLSEEKKEHIMWGHLMLLKCHPYCLKRQYANTIEKRKGGKRKNWENSPKPYITMCDFSYFFYFSFVTGNISARYCVSCILFCFYYLWEDNFRLNVLICFSLGRF